MRIETLATVSGIGSDLLVTAHSLEKPLTQPNMKKKRTEITIEIDEVKFIDCGRSASVHFWCPECSAITAMVTPQRAAAIAGVTVRHINRLVEAERVHFAETESGLLLLCINSLR